MHGHPSFRVWPFYLAPGCFRYTRLYILYVDTTNVNISIYGLILASCLYICKYFNFCYLHIVYRFHNVKNRVRHFVESIDWILAFLSFRVFFDWNGGRIVDKLWKMWIEVSKLVRFSVVGCGFR